MQSNKLLKFYANTPTELNRYFQWRVSSRFNAINSLKSFQRKGWQIKAAWYINKDLCVNEQLVGKTSSVL